MSEVLEDIIEQFPEFLTDEPINGGDLVEVIGGMITRYEENRPKPPEPSHWTDIDGYPVKDWQYQVANGDTRLGYLDWTKHAEESDTVPMRTIQCADCGTKSHFDAIGQVCSTCNRGIIV